jgi:hypothetical protein
MTYNRVRVGSLYRFHPVLIDSRIGLDAGTIVRVINLYGCPPANMMGQCYIEHLGGEFIQMVCVNSLQKLTGYERKQVKRVRTQTKYRSPSTHYAIAYGNGTGDDEAQRLTWF